MMTDSIPTKSSQLVEGCSRSDINIVFCFDRNALVGFHITLASLLYNVNPERPINLFLVTESISSYDLELILKTIRISGRTVSVTGIKMNSDVFASYDEFVGGYMTYARLFLSEILDISRVIYLDTDLIVGTDIAELWDIELDNLCLGAVSWELRSSSHDTRLFFELNENLEQPYFNSGVLLMNLKRMRELRIPYKLKMAAKQLSGRLLSHDQSLLNLCLFEETCQIPRRFNTTISPRRRAIMDESAKDRILHLVARPKPWDPLGKLNGQYIHYENYSALSALSEKSVIYRLDPKSLLKIIRSFRGYVKCLFRA